MWGTSGKFDVVVPHSHLSGTALVNGNPAERNVSALNDPRSRGRTTPAGVRDGEVPGNSRIGATLGLPVSRNNSIKLYASADAQTMEE